MGWPVRRARRTYVRYVKLAAALALLLAAVCQAVPVWVYHGAAPLALLRTAGLQAAWSLPLAVPSYFVCRVIAGRKLKE